MYYISFIWAIFISLFYKEPNQKNLERNIFYVRDLLNRVILVLGLVPLFLIAALRFNVGTDYIVYSNKQIPSVLNGTPEAVEPLYRVVINLGNYISDSSYQWIFVITHFIIIYFVGKAIYLQSHSYIWSIYIFIASGFFNYSMNIMRQSIAIAIFLYAFNYFYNNKSKYLICIIIASLFHYSAIIYFLLPLLKKLNLVNKFSFIFLAGMFIFRNIIRQILFLITSYIGRYNQYFGSHLDMQRLGTIFLFVNLVILIIYYWIIKNSEYLDKHDDRLSKMYFTIQYIATFVVVISVILPNYERLMYMFMAVQIISIPFFMKKIDKWYLKLFISMIIVFIHAFCFYRLFIIGNIGETFPYNSIL